MRLQDLHTHSLFDDGKNSLEEMVGAAYLRGLSAIGLSGHSPIENETAWTMPREKLPAYLQEAKRLKEAYQDKITVFCGIEYDFRSQLDLSGFDYVIGSLHATITPEGSFDTDNTPAIAKEGIDRYFAGDSDAAAKAYFAQYAIVAGKREVDIVGHFDLLTKYNDRIALYNPESPRYLNAALKAMDSLVEAGKIFEVNSGAISRGYRTAPYPAENLLRALSKRNAKILLTSDSHSVQGIGCQFAQSLELVQACGFDTLWFLMEDSFQPVKIKEIE